MYEFDFTFRNTTPDELLSYVVIDGKGSVIFRRRKVAEHKLRRFLLSGFLPNTIDVIHAGVNFTALKIG